MLATSLRPRELVAHGPKGSVQRILYTVATRTPALSKLRPSATAPPNGLARAAHEGSHVKIQVCRSRKGEVTLIARPVPCREERSRLRVGNQALSEMLEFIGAASREMGAHQVRTSHVRGLMPEGSGLRIKEGITSATQLAAALLEFASQAMYRIVQFPVAYRELAGEVHH